MQDKIKGIAGTILGAIVLWIVLTIVSALVVIVIALMPLPKDALTFDTTYNTWSSLSSLNIYGVIESWFMEPIQTIFGPFVKDTIQSLEFRLVLLLVTVLATVMMGLAMLIGEQKITIKEFAIDVLIIYGTAAFLLHPKVDEYIEFLYNDVIVASSNWATTIFTQAICSFLEIDYVGNTQNPTYGVMDMIAGLFFDETIAKRVRTKILGLLFKGYIHYVPILGIVLLYAVFSTMSVFFAILSAKLVILLTLQFLPFFLLFAAINDVQIKISKDPRNKKTSSFLWRYLDAGLIQPWIFITLITVSSGIMLYVFVLSPLSDIFRFTVYIIEINGWLDTLTWIPIFGAFIELFIKHIPKASGLDAHDMHKNLGLAIMGLIVFRATFPMIVGYVKSVSFSSGGAASGAFTEGGGVFSANNSIGGVMEPIMGAPLAASEKIGQNIMSKASSGGGKKDPGKGKADMKEKKDQKKEDGKEDDGKEEGKDEGSESEGSTGEGGGDSGGGGGGGG